MKTIITVKKCYELFFRIEKENHHPDSAEVKELCESLSGRYSKPAFTIEVVWCNEIREPFRIDSIIDAPKEISETTCNLCSKSLDCLLRQDIINKLEIHRAIGTIHNDFDEIMADLAEICFEFEGE